MVDNELLCNFRRCRRPLDGVAWVTFCSHIFCNEDGKRINQTPCECPACGAKLTNAKDVMKLDLDPTEQFKSMILCGLQPSVIMEICYRALDFWTYQMKEERDYQQHEVKRLRERLQEVETYYEQVVRGRDDQLAALKRQMEGCRKEHAQCKKVREALSEKLAEKARQYQRLQSLYDSQRKRASSTAAVPYASPPPEPAIANLASHQQGGPSRPCTGPPLYYPGPCAHSGAVMGVGPQPAPPPHRRQQNAMEHFERPEVPSLMPAPPPPPPAGVVPAGGPPIPPPAEHAGALVLADSQPFWAAQCEDFTFAPVTRTSLAKIDSRRK